MAKIDARQTLSVDEIGFSVQYSISGNVDNPLISVKTQGQGLDRVICAKTDIDNLIKALELAKRVW